MSDFIERKRRWDAAFMDPNSNAEWLLGEAFHLIEDLVEALPSPEPAPIGATEPADPCWMCGGDGEQPDPAGLSLITCGHCNGSGLAAPSVAPAPPTTTEAHDG